MSGDGLGVGPDGRLRCAWGLSTPGYVDYHDTEWGFPVTADQALFEKLCLEGFQAGLSWRTVLEKRAAFRDAFAGFDFDVVARFGGDDVKRLVLDAGIIRHRGKIVSTINNARRAIELREEFGSLAAYVWRFEPGASSAALVDDVVPTLPLPSVTIESSAMSRDLKRRGWTFVGPTTLFAFMQAMGLVNQHLAGCWVRPVVEQRRRELPRPV